MATCTSNEATKRRTAPGPAAATVERRELDARSGDGLHVRLLWDPVTDRVTVTVAHLETGIELEVPVGDGEEPLDVFHHPFAYSGDGLNSDEGEN